MSAGARLLLTAFFGLLFAASGVTKFADPAILLEYVGQGLPFPRVAVALVIGVECTMAIGLLSGRLRGRQLLMVPCVVLALTAIHVGIYLIRGARQCPCGFMPTNDLRAFLGKNAVLMLLSIALCKLRT